MVDVKGLSPDRFLYAEAEGTVIKEMDFPLDTDTTLVLESITGGKLTHDDVHGGHYMSGRNFNGVLDSIADTLIYHRIWVEPLEVDAGFITEESETNIYVWNAEYGKTAYITALDSTLPDGTSFSLDAGDIPVTLGADAEIIYVVTVEALGPSVQDTYYTMTIDGTDYAIYIFGSRVIPLNQEPDWSTLPKMRYRFQTTISQSSTYDEQRRSLTNTVLREAILLFTIQNQLMNRFINDISFGKDKVFGIPIYSEISIAASEAAAGTTTIQLTGETDYHWNLNNISTHVLVINFEEDIYEIKEVSTINSTNIVLARQLINTYPAGSLVFPIFFATLKGVKLTGITDNTETISLEFTEFILGSIS